ncbi:NAD-dependent epimerase/dehydratase family protein [Mesorhizobium sp. RIZ17]|uniref:NAD-dependent epimerase/dehydratase family protein n=1 Tax=Mesorhizobium sp. RIZ17 TaxID=3132743 RepID=UPI003DAA2374
MHGVCLVTGGAGFIGCAISDKLAQKFDRVVAIDNLHPQIHAVRERPKALSPHVELIVSDVTDTSTWDDVLTRHRPDVIVHLAAETGTGQSLTEATRHALVNVVGTTRMLDALAKANHVPSRFVLSSSRAVYGEGAWKDSASGATIYPGQRSKAQLEARQWDFPNATSLSMSARHTRPDPTSVYGSTKLTQEQVLRAWTLSFGSVLNVLRLQNVYGPGQSLTNSYTGIVSLFIRMAKEGRSIPVYEDGDIGRDFILIDDVANAIAEAADADLPKAEAFDIGTGEKTTILRLAEIIAKRYGAPAPQITGAFRNGDVRCAVADIADTTKAMRWRPQFPVEKGISILGDWIDTLL